MNKCKRIIDHKGSTLLMVIICLALIGILGSLLLSVSMVNYQMKKVENNSRKNFYTCEKALEEIKTGLEEMTASTIKLEYEDVLKNYVLYSVLSETDRSNRIQGEVIQKLINNYSVFAKRSVSLDGYKEYKEDISNLFETYISSPDGYTVTISEGSTYSPVDIVSDNANGYYLLFKNVNIKYLENNYSTAITTDIRVTIPFFTFHTEDDSLTYSMQQPYAGYALVADGNIQSVNSDGTNTIRGNVYAGNEILVSDSSFLKRHIVNITGNNITTRGDIIVKDTATLNIGSSTNKPLLWANNLLTDTTNYYSTIAPTTLNVNAISLLKDDLTLNGRNSSVTMSGAYLGYSGQHSAAGSSIIVNGSGSSLDLSGLSTLLLAGRAHISVEDSMLHVVNNSVMTGESLALKSNQSAYLIPGEYIRMKLDPTDRGFAAMHNPITDADLTAVNLSGVTVSLLPNVEVTNSDLRNYLGISVDREYLNSTVPYRIISRQTTLDSHILRYYYYNFASGRMGDRFFEDYFNNTYFKTQLELMNAFQPASVIIPAESDIYSVGNVMSYRPAVGSTSAELNCLSGLSYGFANDSEMDQFIANKGLNALDDSAVSIFHDTVLDGKKVSDLSDLYFNMTHYLSPTASSSVYDDTDQVVASTVKNNGITEVIADSDAGSKVTGFTYGNSLPADPKTLSIVIKNGDTVIASEFNGLLITTGNVTISAGARINGIIIAASNGSGPSNVTIGNGASVYGRIIATGNIYLGANCTIDCTRSTYFAGAAVDTAVDVFLSDMFKTNGKLLWELFVNPDVTINMASGTVSSDLINIDHLVTCENWRKNIE